MGTLRDRTWREVLGLTGAQSSEGIKGTLVGPKAL